MVRKVSRCKFQAARKCIVSVTVCWSKKRRPQNPYGFCGGVAVERALVQGTLVAGLAPETRQARALTAIAALAATGPLGVPATEELAEVAILAVDLDLDLVRHGVVELGAAGPVLAVVGLQGEGVGGGNCVQHGCAPALSALLCGSPRKDEEQA